MAQKIVAPQYGIGRAMHHPQHQTRTATGVNRARAKASKEGRFIVADACPELAALAKSRTLA